MILETLFSKAVLKCSLRRYAEWVPDFLWPAALLHGRASNNRVDYTVRDKFGWLQAASARSIEARCRSTHIRRRRRVGAPACTCMHTDPRTVRRLRRASAGKACSCPSCIGTPSTRSIDWLKAATRAPLAAITATEGRARLAQLGVHHRGRIVTRCAPAARRPGLERIGFLSGMPCEIGCPISMKEDRHSVMDWFPNRKKRNSLWPPGIIMVKYLEMLDLKCAWRPWVLWHADKCSTWIRHRRGAWLWCERRLWSRSWTTSLARSRCEGAPEKLGNEAQHSTKRTFAALALLPVLGYGADDQLHYYAYDLTLWSALGAKSNLNLETVSRDGRAFFPQGMRIGGVCTWGSNGNEAGRGSNGNKYVRADSDVLYTYCVAQCLKLMCCFG